MTQKGFVARIGIDWDGKRQGSKVSWLKACVKMDSVSSSKVIFRRIVEG